MARAVEQIERDIAALEEAVSAIAAELKSAYARYLKILGQAVRQHLILATYQLCTQGYPEPFLGLSFSQRQQLQQAIRKSGQNTADELLTLLETTEEEDEEEEELEITDLEIDNEEEENISYSHPSNPQRLAQWQQNLEEEIADSLKSVSREANLLLQQTGIVPNKLTPPLLEAAATASEASTEMVTGTPNILNLLVEAENPEQPEDPDVTQIIAINLRLTEIEFADVSVRTSRNQIRNIEAKARSLSKEYQKKQQERVVAEAEAAWRASWFDD